jgi:uncharacterized membrane protein
MPDSGMRELGSAADGPARASAVNSDGVIAGALIDYGDSYGLSNVGAVVWSASGKRNELFSCGNVGECAAAAVNRDGVVVGSSLRGAYRWTVRGGLEQLPSPLHTAVGINDLGFIVGQITGGAAVLWPDGTLHTLGTLPGKQWVGPAAINNRGQVVGIVQ